jgi:hypothetical protein
MAVDTDMAKLKEEKDRVWDNLLQTVQGSAESNRLEQKYVDVCRKILRERTK